MVAQDRLFRFIVIADTHVNPVDNDQSSPYESHKLTNDRLKGAVARINQLRPEFVVHVGDMLHPVPESASYSAAADRFRSIMGTLSAPFYLIAGNHDCGDKSAAYVPAGAICDDYVQQYSKQFGAHYYSFDHAGCHFVAVNTSLLNSGLRAEREQAQWLLDDLRRHRAARIFLFIHYPLFVNASHEPGNYDNLDEPARAWMLKVIEDHGVEAVFSAHVHNFFFNRIGKTNIYHVLSTAFVRSDYAEVLQSSPRADEEGGRNDADKLGVVVVDVYKTRIVPQYIRTLSPKLSDGTRASQRDWPRLHPSAGTLPCLGIDMRQGWTGSYEIPYSSMLDEFDRKAARNDYLIMSLCEMGVRRLRVPLRDLTNLVSRDRLTAVAALGVKYIVFSFGLPDRHAVGIIAAHCEIVDGLELILRWPIEPETVGRIAELKATLGVPISISRFWNAAGESRSGKQIKLLVDHGFSAGDQKLEALRSPASSGTFDRVVFRIGRGEAAWRAIEQSCASAVRLGTSAQIHLRLAGNSPASVQADEWENTRCVLEGALCSHFYRKHSIILDTLSDVDQGYFRRGGLIDRRANPKMAGCALRNLNGVLSELEPLTSLEWREEAATLVAIGSTISETVVLALPYRPDEAWSVLLPPIGKGLNWLRTDLLSGAEQVLEGAKASFRLEGKAGALEILKSTSERLTI